MKLEDPVVAYIAESNHEAELLKAFLTDHGIACAVIADDSLVGFSVWGRTVLHRPKIWVGKQDVERVHQFLEEFETLKKTRETKGSLEENVKVCVILTP